MNEEIRSHYCVREVKFGTYASQRKLIDAAIMKDPSILRFEGILLASVYTSLTPEFLGDSPASVSHLPTAGLG